jgi:hypothetical protein
LVRTMLQNVESIRRPRHREQPTNEGGGVRQPDRASRREGMAVQLVERPQPCGAKEIDPGKVDDQVPPGCGNRSQSFNKAVLRSHVQITVQVGDSTLIVDVHRAREFFHRFHSIRRVHPFLGALCQPEPGRCIGPAVQKKGNQTDLWGQTDARRAGRTARRLQRKPAASVVAIVVAQRLDFALPTGVA